MNNTDPDFQLFLKIILVTIGGFIGVVFLLQLTSSAIKGIEDYVKYNRYKEAVQEYRECAENQKDEHSVLSFCGEPPSSIIML